MAKRLWYPLAASLAFAACGGDGGGDNNNVDTSEVDVRSGAPAEGTISAMSALEAESAVEALGIDSDGRVLAVAGSTTYEVDTSTFEARALYAGPGDPTATGHVFAVAPKMEGGAWIAADAGLFIVDTVYVVKSPLVVGEGAIRGAAQVESGGLSGLWIAGDAGLFRSRDPKLEKYPLEVLDSTMIESIAVQGDGNAALVMADGQLALLEVDGEKVISDAPPLEAGKIHAIAAGAHQLYAAAEYGLLRFDRSADPKWTRFTLAAEGETSDEVVAVVVDQNTGKVFARTSGYVVELDGDRLAHFSVTALADGAPALIAADAAGDVWLAEDVMLQRVTLGEISTQVTFTENVLPWISMNCSKCHKNQTQNFEDYAVFKDLAELALSRVRAGDMPRCDGGVPCAEARLNSGEYSVLENWIRDGKPE